VRHQIRHNPDFGAVQVTFDQPGEQILAESGAMVSRDSAIEMKTSMQGGLGGALKRKLLGGESVFQNTFTATAPNQSLWLAPAPEGNIECVELQPGGDLFMQSGAYLASAPSVTLDTKWQGAKGFFAKGLFLLRATGQGPLWFSTYGGTHVIDIGPQAPYQGYICDNSHMVAFTAGLQYNVRKLSGMKSLFLSGEGLVCEFTGQGRLWMQTRNPASLVSFLHPFRPVKARRQG
jgi:uncharacterized protein (TIGR00266 family)